MSTSSQGRETPGGADSMAQQRSGLERWVPGIRTARTYKPAWARPDIVAGVVLAAILVPQGMAYAELAGLPPVTGLYTTIGCLVGYAVFGPSRVLVLGPDSSVSPMIFAAIMPLLAGGGPSRAIALAGMLALIVALIEIGLGLAKLGFVADLLSNEVQVGYMNGLALIIIVGQLPKLFGFSTEAEGFGHEVRAFFTSLDLTVWPALLTGLGVLAVLLVLPKVTRRVPAVLVAVVGATVVSAVLDLSAHGVKTVGVLPRGVPAPSLPWTKLADVAPLMVAAIGITLVSLADTIATSASFGARRGEEVDPNQEMIGLGAANLAAGLVQGFAVSTSGSRTAVVEQAGAKSQLASLVGAGRRSRPPVVPQLRPGGPAAVGPGRGPDRGGFFFDGPQCSPSLLPREEERLGPVAHGHGRSSRIRGAPGHSDRHRPGRPVVLPPELATKRHGPRPGRRS